MPLNTPEFERVTPLGKLSTMEKLGNGKPLAAKLYVEGVLAPITNPGIGPVLMMTGASFIVRVKLWVKDPKALVATTSKV